MKFVEPIRDRKKITQIKNLLRGQSRYRDLLLFVVGINTALRISDLLKLQANQFIDEDGQVKNRFWIKEQKRGKRHEITINQSIQEALTEYLEAFPFILRDPQSYLFFNPRTKQHIKRGQAWKFITTICQEVGGLGHFQMRINCEKSCTSPFSKTTCPERLIIPLETGFNSYIPKLLGVCFIAPRRLQYHRWRLAVVLRRAGLWRDKLHCRPPRWPDCRRAKHGSMSVRHCQPMGRDPRLQPPGR